jgi:predicted lipoprotein with Yx(FWY)xxD motif
MLTRYAERPIDTRRRRPHDRAVRRIVLSALVALVAGALLVGAAAPAPAVAVVKTAYNATLKTTIVVDGAGRTLYMFVPDGRGTPVCAAAHPDCPKVWPAFATRGKPRAGKGIDASLLSVTKGAGGARQVAYNRHPLYYFRGGHGTGAGDRLPGHVRGQGVHSLWFVLSAKGTPIRARP